jgi:hypothetical protein
MEHLGCLFGVGFVFALCVMPRQAPATVLDFDDLPLGYNLTINGYAGLTWEPGSPDSEGKRSSWVTSSNGTFGYPFSQPRNVFNSGGSASTAIGIAFPFDVDMTGAYFAAQGAPSSVWATSITVRGFREGIEISTSGTLGPVTTVSQWLDLSAITGVDRIVVESGLGTGGIGSFGMDDLTFTYVPEPAGISLGLLGLGGLLLRRRCRGG